MKTEPPDKSGRPNHPPAREHLFGWIRFRIFIFFGFRAGHRYYVFSQVITRPARPNKYTYYYTKLPDPLSLSFSFLLCYSVTTHRRLTLNVLPPSLSAFSLSFIIKLLSSSSFFTIKLLARAHGSFFTGTVKLSSLSRCLLGEELFVTGWLQIW